MLEKHLISFREITENSYRKARDINLIMDWWGGGTSEQQIAQQPYATLSKASSVEQEHPEVGGTVL